MNKKSILKFVVSFLIIVFVANPITIFADNNNYHNLSFETDIVSFESLDDFDYVVQRIVYNRNSFILSIINRGENITDEDINNLLEYSRQYPMPRAFFGTLVARVLWSIGTIVVVTIIDWVLVETTGSSLQQHISVAVDLAMSSFANGLRGTRNWIQDQFGNFLNPDV